MNEEGPMVSLVLNAVMNSRQLHARRDAAGALVLEYGRGWRVLGIGLAVVWSAIFAFLLVDSPPKPDDVPVALTMVAIVAAGLSVLLATTYRFSIRLSDGGIRKRSPWTREVVASWGQVQRLTYNAAMRQFLIETVAGKIRVPRYVDGLATLRDEIERRVPSPCWSPAKLELDSAARGVAKA